MNKKNKRIPWLARSVQLLALGLLASTVPAQAAKA